MNRMTTDNPVAEHLLEEARKKSARAESPVPGTVSLIVGMFALLVSPISILGWIAGAATIGAGAIAMRRPASARRAKTAMVLGAVAILIGVFFFTLNIAIR